MTLICKSLRYLEFERVGSGVVESAGIAELTPHGHLCEHVVSRTLCLPVDTLLLSRARLRPRLSEILGVLRKCLVVSYYHFTFKVLL